METRRKEQTVRQVAKDTHLVESEKRLLQEKLNDAEKTMTGAARFVRQTKFLKNSKQQTFFSKQAADLMFSCMYNDWDCGVELKRNLT